MSYQSILYAVEDGVATLTLNRPEKLNAYTVEMGEEAVDAFRRARADDAVRAVILTGAGRGFCAGVDLDALKAHQAGAPAGKGPRLGEEDFLTQLPLELLAYPKPVIAAINGAAIGVGVTMVLPCDVRLAAASAKLGVPFAKLGLLPGLGSTHLLPRLVGRAKALELVLSARAISATEAAEIGLVNRVVPDDQLIAEARALASQMAQSAPEVLAAAKAALLYGEDAALADAMKNERERSAELRAEGELMDFELSPEERAFEQEVEAFLREHASPEVMDAHPEQLSQTVDSPAKRVFMGKLAERGWLGMSWPKAYGGAERPGIYDYILTEALSRVGAPQPGKGVGIVGKTIIRHGSERMKREFLPRIMRGEIEFAIGYSEPGAGSDAANMQLKATQAEGGWRLDGQKIWTTSAHFADYYWLGARTDPAAPKHKGITLFLIPMGSPGLSIRPTWTIGDERTNEVFFDGVFAPDESVVGQLNQGWTYVCEALDLERFAMMPIGPLEKKVEALFAELRAARSDGRPLREQPEVRARVARIAAELEVARMLQRRVIAEAVKGGVPTVASSMYKLFMNETGKRVANAALDLLGPGAELESGVPGAPLAGRFARSYRYTVVDTIGGGTSEIQKNIIARRALGLPASY